METKGFIYMFLLMAYLMGTIGGIGYACFSKAYVIAAAVAVLAVMAFPKAKEIFEKWKNAG